VVSSQHKLLFGLLAKELFLPSGRAGTRKHARRAVALAIDDDSSILEILLIVL
jgi:hypothetical protein